jgi:hypothetical protein
MDSTSLEALAELRAAIQSLLPPAADPNLKPLITVQPMAISPAGLGGFVGINDDPVGEIIGRRVDATVLIDVKAAADGIDAAVAGVTTALLAADRGTLIGLGILRIALDTLGEQAAAAASVVQQQVGFRVLYEYLKTPSEPEGIIREIPLNIQLQQ